MSGYTHLPTWVSAKWSVAAFRDSLISALGTDRSGAVLKMYFYAVTQSGWDQVRQPVLQWRDGAKDREVILYVGTDHGITDPSALRQISEDGVDVRLMLEYHGVFHPKVVWLWGTRKQIVWVGSNNLTRDGLLNNIEFAMLVKAQTTPRPLKRWTQSIEAASTVLTQDLLKSYERQRQTFEKLRARAKATTFIWKQKIEPQVQPTTHVVDTGSLIVEVMPRETGGDGRQLQLPTRAASKFFNVRQVGSSKTINLRTKGESIFRALTMTMFGNNTVRIVIRDLEFRDRPCMIVFRKMSNKKFEYEIVSQNIFPSRYKALLALCSERTRKGSRRWRIV